MPRERDTYRDNLERIKERYPTKEVMNVEETARFLGLERRTVKKHFAEEFSRGKGLISVATLARRLS